MGGQKKRHVLVRSTCVPFVHKYQLAHGRAVRQRLVMCHTCTVVFTIKNSHYLWG